MTKRLDAVRAHVQLRPREWLVLEHPLTIVEATDRDDVARAIEEVETLAVSRGWYAAGFVSYEAGADFGLKTHEPAAGTPLVWFALFDAEHVRLVERIAATATYELGALIPTVTESSFAKAFGRIHEHLADGDSYQVNYTFRLEGAFSGDPFSFWADLVAAQRGGYSVYLDLGNQVVCSASPELFFLRQGDFLTVRPMKGTARRGLTVREDRALRDALAASAKQQAENVMVVDMLRNDLGRIARVGSVEVPKLFEVERYPTVWQMTSVVQARSSASLAALFGALHPSASVTGAPKVRTMEILASLETEPRGVYTGAVGYIAPNGDARFNVAIRTAVVDRALGRVTFGVGSGIVWDSSAADEYAEGLLKAAVISQPRRWPADFELLETMLWTGDEGVFLLDRHLERLGDSAEYFDFPCPLDEIRSALVDWNPEATAPETPPAGRQTGESMRLRLLVDRQGRFRVESSIFEPPASPLRGGIARQPVDPSDVFLYHKTTNRSVYDRLRLSECDETVLWNPDGQVTELITGNIVVELDGRKVTPPVASGLLGGTLRAELLARGELLELVVTLGDLHRASQIWLINSVQGWRPVKL